MKKRVLILSLITLILVALISTINFLNRLGDRSIESALVKNGINFKQIIHSEPIENTDLVFYEDINSQQIGIALLKKRWDRFKVIGSAGYAQKNSMDYPWSFTSQSIGGNYLAIYYGYISDSSIINIAVENTSSIQKVHEATITSSNIGKIWFAIFDYSNNFDVGKSSVVFYKSDGTSIVR